MATAAARDVTCTIVKASSQGSLAGKSQQQPALLKEVRLVLQIVDQDGRRAAVKTDGLRFTGGADSTVKLCADMVYKFSLTTTPAVVFRGPILIRTRRAECYEPGILENCCCLPMAAAARNRYADLAPSEWQGPEQVELSAPSQAAQGGPVGAGGSRASAEAEWMCGMELTGRGVRGLLEVEVEVEDYGRVCLPLQAKVYAMGDTSAHHGVSLSGVEYLLVKHGITGAIRVLSTQYLK